MEADLRDFKNAIKDLEDCDLNDPCVSDVKDILIKAKDVIDEFNGFLLGAIENMIEENEELKHKSTN